MSKEIIQMIKVLAAEKDIPAEDIFQGMELALATAASKGQHCTVRAILDRNSGAISYMRRWEVVQDEDYKATNSLGEVIYFDPIFHKALEEAKKIDRS